MELTSLTVVCSNLYVSTKVKTKIYVKRGSFSLMQYGKDSERTGYAEQDVAKETVCIFVITFKGKTLSNHITDT